MRAYLCLLASAAAIAIVACGSDHDSATSTNGTDPNAAASSSSGATDMTPTVPTGTADVDTTNAADAGATTTVTATPDASADAATPAAPPDVTMTSVSTTYNGQTRNYLLGTPRDYDASKAYPVVMLFHGNPGTKEEMRSTFQFEAVTHTDAILVYPDAFQNDAWDLYTPTDTNVDMPFIDALPGILAQTLHIDPSRVYGFGFSGGSFFLTQFTCRFAGVFRAVAINSGGGPVEQQMGYPQRADGCYICPAGPVASLVVHGDSDTVVNYQSGAYTAQCLSETDNCASTTSPADPSPCVTYDNCTSKPVKWCLIPGLNHAPWSQAQTEAWSFFNNAP